MLNFPRAAPIARLPIGSYKSDQENIGYRDFTEVLGLKAPVPSSIYSNDKQLVSNAGRQISMTRRGLSGGEEETGVPRTLRLGTVTEPHPPTRGTPLLSGIRSTPC